VSAPSTEPPEPGERSAIIRDGLAVGIATGAYGISFGAISVAAGLSVLQTCALSLLVFTGASQFALVGVVASGGADGSYLENACPDAESLAVAYGTVLDATGARRLEIDIEQDVPTATIVEALIRLQRERGTDVTLTLQVESAEHGLTAQAVDALSTAAAAGLDVRANAMVMNFPDGGDWAGAMTSAADRIAAQIVEVRPDLDEAAARRLLGLTFMIGRNDSGPVTTLDDAARLAEYAAGGGAGSLAFWSVGRDNGDCPDGTLQSTCSGIAQDRYAFARALAEAT
jgi:chitinase